MNTSKNSMGKLTAHLTSAIAAGRQLEPGARVEPALVDAKQAAHFLCVSLRGFHTLRPQLPAPVVLGGGRVVRWKTAELRSYVDGLAAAAARPEPPQLAAARVKKQGADDVRGAEAAEPAATGLKPQPRRGAGKRPVQSNPQEQTS